MYTERRISNQIETKYPDCPFCDSNKRDVRKGPFYLQCAPPAATFNGVNLKLGPAEFRLLELVMRRGSVPWSILENLVPASEDAGPSVVGVVLYNLRRKLMQVDPAAKSSIQAIRGWGLRLVVE
jgi:DNA-binding response OmpR family regulator